MKYVLFFLLLLWGLARADGISNEYGKFAVSKKSNDYSVSFVINGTNKRFVKIEKVAMIDYGNDGRGDIVVISHRNGDREILFRDEAGFNHYLAENRLIRVCENGWSDKMQYKKNFTYFKCKDINFVIKWFLWGAIDGGLEDAKNEDWNTLSARLMKYIEKLQK